MESVPGAVATGLTLASSSDAATNDRFRTRLRLYPVDTAPGTDLIPQTKTSTIVCLLRTRIHPDLKRLGITLPTRGQLHSVCSGQNGGNTATSEATTTAATSSCGSLRRRRPQIPNPSMHSRRGRKRLRGAHPKRGNVELVGIDWRRLVFA